MQQDLVSFDPPTESTDIDPSDKMETEEQMLAAFMQAAASRPNTAKIIIRREDKNIFAFRIHPLDEVDFQRIRNKHTKNKVDRRLGVSVPIDTDIIKYRTELIYEATIATDQRNMWDNPKAQQAKGVLSGFGLTSAMDLIEAMLLAGEKDAVINRIEEISGYGAEVELQENLKN